MISRVQAQPSRNTFGSYVETRLARNLTDIQLEKISKDRRDDRSFLVENVKGEDTLVMKIYGKGKIAIIALREPHRNSFKIPPELYSLDWYDLFWKHSDGFALLEKVADKYNLWKEEL